MTSDEVVFTTNCSWVSQGGLASPAVSAGSAGPLVQSDCSFSWGVIESWSRAEPCEHGNGGTRGPGSLLPSSKKSVSVRMVGPKIYAPEAQSGQFLIFQVLPQNPDRLSERSSQYNKMIIKSDLKIHRFGFCKQNEVTEHFL